MKKILTVLVSLLMVLCLVGCGAKEEDTATTGGEAKDTYTIAFSLKTVTNDAFQQAIATAVENAAKAAGCEFQLVTVDSETDGIFRQGNRKDYGQHEGEWTQAERDLYGI